MAAAFGHRWRGGASGIGWRTLSSGTVMTLGVALAGIGPVRADLLSQFISPDVPGTDVQRDVSVLSRLRPAYDPLGVRVGDFTIRPQVNVATGYDDNATGTSKPRGSALVVTDASVSAGYDHSRMSAAATLSVDDNEYLQQTQQSYTNWQASLAGSYDLGRDVINVSYTHQNLNQTVQDLDVPQLDQALAYRIDEGKISYRAQFNRLFVVPALTVSRYSYDNGTVGGTVYQQNFRDHVLLNPSLTAGYILGRYSLVAVLRDAQGSFSNRLSGSPTRNFNDVSALAGIDYSLTGLLRFRLLAGYEVRTFTSAAYKTIAAPVVEGSVIWNPTGLTTVTGQAARRIQDAADETVVGLTESSFNLRVDHELYRNVLLRATVGYIDDQYGDNQGTQSATLAGVGATYLMNRNMQLSGSYDFAQRHSSGAIATGGIGFTNLTGIQQLAPTTTDNRFLLQLRLGL